MKNLNNITGLKVEIERGTDFVSCDFVLNNKVMYEIDIIKSIYPDLNIDLESDYFITEFDDSLDDDGNTYEFRYLSSVEMKVIINDKIILNIEFKNENME